MRSKTDCKSLFPSYARFLLFSSQSSLNHQHHKTLVDLHLAAQTASVAQSTITQCARAKWATLARHPRVDLSVWLVPIAPRTRLALIKNARILVLVLAVPMHAAMWSTTTLSVVARLVLLVILSLTVAKRVSIFLFSFLYISIP